MKIIDIQDLNTIIQLSIALNVVCIATFKVGQFGRILESTILKTEEKIDQRIKEIESLIKIGLESLQVVVCPAVAGQEVTRIQNEYNKIQSDLSSVKKELHEIISEKCTPKHIDGLSSYCTLFGIVTLYFILFSRLLPMSLFHLYVFLSIKYVFLFILLKWYLDKRLFKQLTGDNSTNKKKYEKRQRMCDKILSVRRVFIIHSIILVLSVLFYFINKVCVDNNFILGTIGVFWINLIECCAAFIPFSAFGIYTVVTWFYNNRRKEYINYYLIPKENAIKTCQRDKNEFDTYIKVNGRLTVSLENAESNQ